MAETQNTGQFAKTIVTDVGKDMIAKSQNGQTLTFSRVALGDGVVGEEEDVTKFTAVKNERLSLPIAKYSNLGNGQFQIQFRLTNSQVESGFWHREIGIMAKIDNGQEQLYAYTTAGNKASFIYDKTTPVEERIVNVNFVIGNAQNLEVIINSSVIYATIEDLEEALDAHDAGADAHEPAFDAHNAADDAHKDFTGATAKTAGKRGMVPAPAAGSANRYLRSDGSWQVPPDTKYSNMEGATSSSAGSSGLVPAPAAGDQNKALFGDKSYKSVVQSINGVVADNEGDVSLRNALYCHDASEFMEELGTAGWNSKGVYAVTFSNTQNFPQKPSNSYFALFNLAEASGNGYAVQMLFNIINGDLYTRGTNNQAELDEVPFKRLAFYSEVLAALPVGTILPFAGGTIPYGFLATNGAAISRTTYSALFSAIGTTYGSGDGSTTFNLPLIEDNRFLEFASTAGTKKNAGLPNITGTFRYDVYATGRTGAFSTGSANDFRAGASQTGTIGQDIQTVFDASDSNSIYGGSTTVQPKSLTVRAIIKY